ncbi:GNAT family N-acetyltransferase [Zoogloea dura]|jgi:ribosomal protein S18 acetylase RimI-like enzyme|uniref:GNAT family N-acetyltransferase n=1 Tax=Zoogloea dura TaxID=2728840 RepID=A0A848G0U9_9RHOO|nr:GNAT family N-acetyltransferase [Zoogloea dura]NML25818.1 GNAT family N-acetyltransferase [Zoogloea dura]
MIVYRRDVPLRTEDIVRVFQASGIRRPIDDAERIGRMFAQSSLVLSAWDGERLVGVCRALTDFSYCCYLSDLAVDRACQHQGIGRELVERCRALLGDEVSVILLSAPEAMNFYPRLGFEPVDNGFIVRRAR